MSFDSPIWLFALAIVPLALAASLMARRRARRYAVRFPAAATLVRAAEAVPAWPRHVATGLALAAMASLALAMAKPHHTVRVARQQASIVLVTDHSGSMEADDVDPTRLSAAQRAAQTFIDKIPGAVRVGAVAFADGPDAIQPPTTDHGLARRVIEGQSASGATATGDALQTAIDLVRQGSKRPPAAIVLLSDGTTTAGRDPVTVARGAGRLGVPIYTVALGTPGATVPNPNPFGPPLSAAPDFATLRTISRVSHASAFTAADSSRLNAIYERLGSQLGSRAERRDITAAFAIGGLLLLLGAGGTSLRRVARLP
ncbi:MAG: Ca-activated chloride channel [Solirubrobacteraceae bacterium]|nr:Ca-activated chloride channel [Solirubrobacteraceae bacterium]